MRLICALSIAFVLGGTPAFADDPYEPQHIPKCSLYETKSGEEVCGYNLDEWKAALVADAELTTTKSRLKKEQERSIELAKQVSLLQDQFNACSDSQKVLTARHEKLTKDLIDLDKKYQYERVKPRLGPKLPWAVAGLSVAVLTGFIVKAKLD